MKSRILNYFQRIALLAVLFPFSISAQNPWNTTTNEPNPWVSGNEEKIKTEEERPSRAPEITSTVKSERIDTITGIQSTNAIKSGSNEKFVVPRSTANVALAGSIISSSFFSVFALPLNLLVPQITTLDNNPVVQDYKESHPEATAAEIQKVKTKVRRKKAGKAAIGSIIGILINTLIIVIATF